MPIEGDPSGLLMGTAVFALLMAGLFVPLEGWSPAHRTGPRTRTAFVCLAFLFGNTFALELVGTPVLGALTGLSERGHRIFETIPVLRVVAVFVLAELAGYWIHRLMHRVPWLWRFHAVHHAPQHINWLETWRQHPVDFVLHGIAVGVPGAILGASLSDIASVVVLRKGFTVFLHANLAWKLTWLEPFVATPAFHRVHHSHDPADHDRHFSGMFPVLDRLFGTLHRRSEPSRATHA